MRDKKEGKKREARAERRKETRHQAEEGKMRNREMKRKREMFPMMSNKINGSTQSC